MRRVYRSTEERMLAGVLGGLAKHFNIDPTIVRLIFVCSLIISVGASLFFYIAAIFIIPNEPGA